MTMRLQEIHPSLVHFPLTLLPLSIGADLIGQATGSDTLRSLARTTMPLAAASAVVAAPEVAPGSMAEAARAAGRDLKEGAKNAIEEARRSEIAPQLAR